MTLTYHDAFKDKLQHLVNVHAPPTEKMMRGKPAPWFTFDIGVAINDRNHYLKVARRTNNKADITKAIIMLHMLFINQKPIIVKIF